MEERRNELIKIGESLENLRSRLISQVCDEKDYDAKKMISWGHSRCCVADFDVSCLQRAKMRALLGLFRSRTGLVEIEILKDRFRGYTCM